MPGNIPLHPKPAKMIHSKDVLRCSSSFSRDIFFCSTPEYLNCCMATLLSLFVIPGEAVSSFRENLLSFWRHGVYATNQQPLVCAIHAPRKRARQAALVQFSNLLKTKSLQNWIPPSPTTSDCDSVAIYLKRPPGESKVLESVIHPTSPRAKQFRQEKLRNGNRGGRMFITHPCDPIGLECQEKGGRHWDAERLKTFSISAPSSLCSVFA